MAASAARAIPITLNPAPWCKATTGFNADVVFPVPARPTKTLNALSAHNDILVGGILHIVNSYNDNTQEIGEWQQVGATFLEKKKPFKTTKKLPSQTQEDASNTNHAK